MESFILYSTRRMKLINVDAKSELETELDSELDSELEPALLSSAEILSESEFWPEKKITKLVCKMYAICARKKP
jgi:hypothetical protein